MRERVAVSGDKYQLDFLENLLKLHSISFSFFKSMVGNIFLSWFYYILKTLNEEKRTFWYKMSQICSKKLKAHCQILIILTTTISFLGNNVLFSSYKVFKSNKILKQKLADNVCRICMGLHGRTQALVIFCVFPQLK